MEIELLPCPFCGETNTTFDNNGESVCWLYCKSCQCDGPVARMTTNDEASKRNAAAAWNKRPALDVLYPTLASLKGLNVAEHFNDVANGRD